MIVGERAIWKELERAQRNPMKDVVEMLLCDNIHVKVLNSTLKIGAVYCMPMSFNKYTKKKFHIA